MANELKNYGRVGVLLGGVSSERAISLKSGGAVIEALRKSGLDVVELDITSSREDIIADQIQKASINVAFIVLHGKFGEDGKMQQILERLEIPFTGSGIDASCLALNKVETQKLMKKNGICVPKYVNLKRQEITAAEGVIRSLGCYPLIIKPATEGSSIGIRTIFSPTDIQEAVDVVFALDDEVIVEKYIMGRELTVGILGQEALPIVEIRPKEKFFSFNAKYTKGLTDYIVPAALESSLAGKISQVALEAFRLAGCRDFSRVDFMLDDADQYYLLEINTIPGFTSTSLLPMAAQQAGIDFNQLCLRIVDYAYGTKKERNENTVTA